VNCYLIGLVLTSKGFIVIGLVIARLIDSRAILGLIRDRFSDNIGITNCYKK